MTLNAGFVHSAIYSALSRQSSLSAEESRFSFTSVITDSRKVAAGCLFVGIKGDHFDGNEFAEKALTSGAAAVLTSSSIDSSKWPNRLIFEVSDSLLAFRQLAAAWRQNFNGPIIGVGGSVGKTTTKEMIASICRGRWSQVLKTESSNNGFVGIPMSIMGLNSTHEVAVIEIGIDEIGAMDQHWNLVKPDIALVTVAGPEHLEKLRDVETAAREEFILLEQSFRDGKSIVLNLDDPLIVQLATEKNITGPRVIAFSMNPAAASTLVGESNTIRGSMDEKNNTLEWRRGKNEATGTIPLPLMGAHNASNLLAATAVGLALGLKAHEINQGIAQFKTPPGRSELRTLVTGQTVICDHYNANPSSVLSALKMSQTIHHKVSQGKGRLWVCLGDMLELGVHEEQMHRDLAAGIASQNIDEVLLIGDRMLWLMDEIKLRKLNVNVRHIKNHEIAAKTLLAEISPSDTLLIKGSRGLKMEKVWEQISKG